MKGWKGLVGAAALVLPVLALLWLPACERTTNAKVDPQQVAVDEETAEAQPAAPVAAPPTKEQDALRKRNEPATAQVVPPAPQAPAAAVAVATAHMVVPAAPVVPPVADKEKIALFYTGNVIGETDPCG